MKGILLDWVIEYVQLVLAAEPMSSSVADALAPLKHELGILEGDFFALRAAEIKTVLCDQLDRILEDGILEEVEELAQSTLQRAFDLSYDEYLGLTRPLYESALRDLEAQLQSAPPAALASLRRRTLSLRAVGELAVARRRSLGGLR